MISCASARTESPQFYSERRKMMKKPFAIAKRGRWWKREMYPAGCIHRGSGLTSVRDATTGIIRAVNRTGVTAFPVFITGTQWRFHFGPHRGGEFSDTAHERFPVAREREIERVRDLRWPGCPRTVRDVQTNSSAFLPFGEMQRGGAMAIPTRLTCLIS